MLRSDYKQGSPEWLADRKTKRNASDASVIMGVSPYKTLDQWLHERVTGIVPEVDEATQRLFDRGHAIEELARPFAEEYIGDMLSPICGTTDDGYLSASFDGSTFDGEVIWENKTLSQAKLADVLAGKVPEADYWQCVQQLVVSGANRLVYTLSDGTKENTHHLEFFLSPGDADQLMEGWKQADEALKTYVPKETAAPVVAAPIEALPAVIVQVQGSLTVSGNLPAFGDALKGFISRIPEKPQTDQEFADCDAACKALKKAEDALTDEEGRALAQISAVEEMRRLVADYKDLARTTRLKLEKLVKIEKENRKAKLVTQAREAFQTYVALLQAEVHTITLTVEEPDFGGAIKGLSSLSSMENQLTAALVEGRTRANIIAARVATNLQLLAGAKEYAFLFADRAELVYKETETLELLIAKRIDDHKRAEAEKLEAERARIEAEAKAKAEAEAQAKIDQERERIRAEEQAKADAAYKAQVVEAAQNQIAQGTPLCAVPDAVAPVMDEPATAEQSSADRPTGTRITLGQINSYIAPISISAAGLSELGFQPVATAKAAKLYAESDLPRICMAIARHLTEIAVIAA